MYESNNSYNFKAKKKKKKKMYMKSTEHEALLVATIGTILKQKIVIFT